MEHKKLTLLRLRADTDYQDIVEECPQIRYKGEIEGLQKGDK